MEIIASPKKLEQYIEQNRIRQYFGKSMPEFLLLHYAPGELLASPAGPMYYAHFLVKGDFRIYDMPNEKDVTVLGSPHHSILFLGDQDLLDPNFVPLFVEAVTDVYTVSFPIAKYRSALLEDPVFLRFLCNTLAFKLQNASSTRPNTSFREQINNYLEFIDPSEPIEDIGRLAQFFNVTTRHMQRALKGLCDDGVLSHPKKGVYYVLDLSKRKY